MNRQKWAVAVVAAGLVSGAAQAALLDRGNGLVYDDLLNITWMQNANLAATQAFGVSGIAADGRMNWSTANAWIAAMNAADYLGYSNWRLPTMSDTGMQGCNWAYGGTDCGFNVQTVSGSTVYSELATLWYTELGNLAYYNTLGNGPQPGFGLKNTGPFTNMQSNSYWTGLEDASATGNAWVFATTGGAQNGMAKNINVYAWAVRSGDVAPPAPIPEPSTLVLALAGMGLAGLRRHRQ